MSTTAPIDKPMSDPPRLKLQENEKYALFIDGANLYAAARLLQIEIDYQELLAYFSKPTPPLRAYYYTAMHDEHEYSPLRPLMDWLDYNGYTMVTKPVRTFTSKTGEKKQKGNMDIELTVDCLELSDHLDHYVIFSGDGDFISLVKALQRRGKRITIVSTSQTSPPILSDELRRSADEYIDLNDIRDIVGRPVGVGSHSYGSSPTKHPI